MKYLRRVFIASSRLLNTILGGHYDHTFSGRSGYNAKVKNNLHWRVWRFIINVITFDMKHCDSAIEFDNSPKVKHDGSIH